MRLLWIFADVNSFTETIELAKSWQSPDSRQTKKEGCKIGIRQVRKRDGSIVELDPDKIVAAIFKAAQSVGGNDLNESKKVAEIVFEKLQREEEYIPHVEEIQDMIERALVDRGHASTAKSYILYRARHAEEREKGLSVDKEITPEPDPFSISDSEYNFRTGDRIDAMFNYKSKLLSLVDKQQIYAYKILYYMLKDMQDKGKLPVHPSNQYLGGNELAEDIYKRKYYIY